MHRYNDCIGGCLSVSASRHGEPLKVTASRAGEPLKVSCHLVCTINRGDERYETFTLSNGDVFILADGKKFKVLKDGIQI